MAKTIQDIKELKRGLKGITPAILNIHTANFVSKRRSARMHDLATVI